MKSLAETLAVISCLLLTACHPKTPQTRQLHSNTNVLTFSDAECDLALERVNWMANRDLIRVPTGADTSKMPGRVNQVFGGLVDQTQKGAAFISLVALNDARTAEARKRIESQIKGMSWEELWGSTASYINAEIEGASRGSYVSRVPRPPKDAEFLETVESFGLLNTAYFKDVLTGSNPALPKARVDALAGVELRSQFASLLDKSGCH